MAYLGLKDPDWFLTACRVVASEGMQGTGARELNGKARTAGFLSFQMMARSSGSQNEV